MENLIEEIKSRLDIVEVIGSYINLKKVGANYTALCPFHSEKKPSFFVSPRLQIFKCFGCGQAGDIFKFVMLIEGVEFGDALRILAKKAGVELSPLSPELQTERKRVYEICELACKFFEKQIEGAKGKLAKEYLLKRGLSEDSIRKWRIGWAPDRWQSLIDFLTQKGYRKKEILKSGLAVEGQRGEVYDRFRGRIIFPIFDLNSQVIGFAGRVFLKEEGAKYLNIPNTILYDKSKVLYGLDKAKLDIRKKDFALLVEGYIDVILSHQVGFENTVSTSGTALSSFQLDLLYRYSENLYLAFDMDPGGLAATERGIDLAQLKGFNIKIVNLPKENDPADLICKDAEEFKKLVNNAVSIMDFYFQFAFSQFSPETLEGKKEILKILLPPIKRIQNKIEQNWWVGELAKRLKVRENDIYDQLNSIQVQKIDEIKKETKEEVMPILKTRKETLEERLLVLVLKEKEGEKLIDEDLLSFLDEKAKEVFEKITGKREKISPEAKELLDVCALGTEIENQEKKDILEEIEFCVREIKKIAIKEKLKELTEKIKEVEIKKDEKELEKLRSEFTNLSKKLSSLESNKK